MLVEKPFTRISNTMAFCWAGNKENLQEQNGAASGKFKDTKET